MKQRPRIYYTESQKALMWERWRKGESLQQIAQLFGRNHSSIQRILAETGGIKVASKDAETFANVLIKNARKLPQELYKSLTWDRGTEMVRIPAKLDSDSTPSWTRIPEQAGQSERSDAGFSVFTLLMS